LAEWLFEAGIGEDRAALIEGGSIVEARIERDDNPARFGAIHTARLRRKAGPNGRGEVELDMGGMALLSPVPPGLTEGAGLLVEVVREAIPERGNPKLPLVRPAETSEPRPAPDFRESVSPARMLRAHEPDALEAAGWSELMEQAETGLVPFPGGLLRIALTPAMTVIDVDGELPAAELAVRGAVAAGAAIRRFGIGGSIGIDLPSVPSKALRLAAAEALDAALPQPFERTAVNGFGFLQVVRRRVRPSLLELVQADPATAAALAALRRAEREPPGRVVLDGRGLRPEWISELERRRGERVSLS
jgi:ribonuclease G